MGILLNIILGETKMSLGYKTPTLLAQIAYSRDCAQAIISRNNVANFGLHIKIHELIY